MDNRVSEEKVRNFHLFWDNFPFPVMLVHKDRTILDQNRAGETAGYVAGSEELYLHFFTDITEYAAERLLPSPCDVGSGGCGSCNCE